MTTLTVNGNTYDSDTSFAGFLYVTAILALAADIMADAGRGLVTTSPTSYALGSGTGTIALATAIPYTAGAYLILADSAAPTTNYALVQASGVASAGGLSFSEVLVVGSGTKTAWNVSISGPRGATGAAGGNGADGFAPGGIAAGDLDMSGYDLTVDLVTVEAAGENAEGNATNATGSVTLQATGAPVLRHTLTGDVTYLVAGAPTPGHGWQVEVRPTQDGTGGRAVTILPANLWTQSNAIDHADWTKTRATTSTAAGTAPDGQTTAVKLVEDGTAAASHTLARSITKAASSLSYVFEGTFERDGRNIRITLADGAGNGVFATINLATGGVLAAFQTTGTGYTATELSVNAEPTGGYKVTMIFSTNSATTLAASFAMADDAGSISYNGDSTSGVIISWLNLVQSSTALGRQLVGATRAGMVTWRTAADEIDFAAQAAATASRILISYGSDGEILVDDVSLG